MERKAQAQVFTYITALIIAGLVVLLGYKGISSLMDAGNKASFARMQEKLKQEVHDTGLSYGSMRTVELELPSGRTGLCFINRNDCNNIRYELIQKSCGNKNLNDNAFLLPDGSEKFGVGEVEVAVTGNENDLKGCACFVAHGNTVSVVIQGQGDRARIIGEKGCG